MRWTAQPDTDITRTAGLPDPLWEVVDEHGDYVAGGFTEEQAKLCAAAPDLLAALQLHLGEHGHTAGWIGCSGSPKVPCRQLCEQTRAAIAKAKGD